MSANTQLVLFDFDGTLADSADDLAAAANYVRQQKGLDNMDLSLLRPYVSKGARGLLAQAMQITPEDAEYESLRELFLNYYEQNMFKHLHLFPGINELLKTLETYGIRWGIVTNKHERFALPIFDHMQLTSRSAACVAGDTLPFSKPHPAPILHAAQLANCNPAQAIYIGDDERDIQAGRAAGMKTIAAAYGYCDPKAAQTWGADAIAQNPKELWPLIQSI